MGEQVAVEGDEFVFPLSFAQRRLWFLSRLEPSSTMYNLPLAVPFDAAVHPSVLEQSINEIVERHETLRTIFRECEGEPMQIIRQSATVPVAVIDLRSLPAEQQEAEIVRLTAELAQRPFDLAEGPLLRTALLQLSPERHVFVLVIHHIIADGWSLGVFWRELITLYNAYYTGSASPLPELPIQYADFAVWQRERLQGERLTVLAAEWRRALDGLPTLQLPTDHPRPPVLTYRGAIEPIRLTTRLTSALKKISRSEGATLFMTTFAAFAALLNRYSGQDDIVVGTPAANRDREELEGLIGFFVNSLVLRVDLSGDPTFRELLARVRQVALDAYAHQEMPFEKLVEELRPERDLGRNPLFQVSFQLIASGAKGTEDRPEAAPAMAINRGSAIFDLAINLWDAGDEVQGQIEYSTDLFDRSSMARLAAGFETILRSVVADPGSLLSELQLLGKAEQRLLLDEWNDQARAVPHRPVHLLFEEQARRQPDAEAVSAGSEALSYGALDRAANALANRLRQLGAGRDAVVAICMERGVRLVLAMLGVLKAGGAYLPLDTAYPAERLAFMLEDSGARIVLSDAASAAQLPATDACVLLLDDETSFDSDTNSPTCEVAPDDLCYVVYTSGSTGEPKGVAVPHRGLMNLVAWHRDALGIVAGDRASQIASAGFDACGWEIWPYLAAGASVHILSDAVRGIPRDLVKALADLRITVAFAPTPLAQMMFEEPALPDLELRHLLTGGDKLTRPPPAGLQFPVVNNYGPSEYSVVATSCILSPDDGDSPPIGRPVANTRIYVLDGKMKPVPIGATGELYIGGAGLARGYLHRPELTAERFVADPFHPGERLYKSGDLARYRADGMLAFVGRADSQIKLRGFRIEIGEIEAALARHRRLRDAVVALVPAPGGSQLAAFVVPRGRPGELAGAAELARQIRTDLAARLPEHMIPTSIVALPELPQLANGKIDRQALMRIHAAASDGVAPASAAPRTPLEEALVMIWCDILGIDEVGIHDNFFEVGGHSLLAARLVSRLREWLKVEVPLQALFRAPTPAQFAERLLADAADPATLEKAAGLVVEVARMSEAEARDLLDRPLAVNESRAP